MAEHLEIAEGSKWERYAALLPQIKSVVEDEPDQIACMANVASMLHETFHWWWTGFYRVVGNDVKEGEKFKGFKDTQELVLGPFQGPMACTRIRRGRGVCGTAWEKDETQVVPDVEQFPGHIACSSASRSEIVVPIHDKEGQVTDVLDIDSDELNTFDEVDREWLEKIASLIPVPSPKGEGSE